MKFRHKIQQSLLFYIYLTTILFLLDKFPCISYEKNDNIITNFNQIGMQLQLKIKKFKQYREEFLGLENMTPTYPKLFIKGSDEDEKESEFLKGKTSEIPELRQIYALYNKTKKSIDYVAKVTEEQRKNLIAYGKFKKTRYLEGWDKLRIKTYDSHNPLLQCYSAGFIEGAISSKEILYYYKNIHVFFSGNKKSVNEIKSFYSIVDKNIRDRIKGDNFENMKDEDFKLLAYITCLQAQINGLYQGYNSQAEDDEKLDLLDFYFINSEGNFGDLKSYMRVNSMKFNKMEDFFKDENLKSFYDTSNINKIWKDLTDKGHCSAVVKLTQKDGKYDIIAGHNTWSDYSELIRTLKFFSFAFEGNKNDAIFGMRPTTLNFSSYPGVLFSGDDFYLINSGIGIIQTTLNVINKFAYKDILNMKKYIPEFMRLQICNFTSRSGEEWVKTYKSFEDHMYVVQFLVIDYNILKKMNDGGKVKQGLLIMTEEAPKSILSRDLTDELLNKGYFGSFNISYFKEHQDILGMSYFKDIDFFDKNHNPRYYILSILQSYIVDRETFKDVILYNGYHKRNSIIPDDPSYMDPNEGLSARGDLVGSYHGGIDFKIIDSEMVKKMNIYAYGGPSYNNDNLKPFVFKNVRKDHIGYLNGIPKVWKFKPFYFGEKDFVNEDE